MPSASTTQVLKDKVFSEGMEQACMEHVESNRFVNSISSFLPFFPLEHRHILKVQKPLEVAAAAPDEAAAASEHPFQKLLLLLTPLSLSS